MESRLEYQDKGTKMGCALIFFMIIGILVTFGTIGFLFIVYSEGGPTSKQFSISLAPLSFGLLAIFTALRNLKFNHRYSLILDKSSNTLEFHKGDESKKLIIPFFDFYKIRLIKTYESNSGGSGNTRKTYFQLFIILRDGSHFWVYSSTSQSAFAEEVNKLKAFLNLTIEDTTGLQLGHEGENQFPVKSRNKINESSKFVQIEHHGLEKTVSVKKPVYLIDEISKILILVFAGSIISIMANTFVESPLVVQLFGLIVFGGFFLLIITVIVLTNSKKYYLTVSEKRLTIRLWFPWKLLDTKLGKTIEIEKENIAQIRTSRLHEGHFWLSCVTAHKLSFFDKVLFGMGAFAKSKIDHFNNSENVIGLWEVPNYAKSKNTADFLDLYYIEQWLQNELGLEEKDLSVQ